MNDLDLEQYPNEAVLHYTLACYDSQFGNIEGSKVRLERAVKLYAGCRQLALDDEDLKPLWDSLAGELR